MGQKLLQAEIKMWTQFWLFLDEDDPMYEFVWDMGKEAINQSNFEAFGGLERLWKKYGECEQ